MVIVNIIIIVIVISNTENKRAILCADIGDTASADNVKHRCCTVLAKCNISSAYGPYMYSIHL